MTSLTVTAAGAVHCVYGEVLDLGTLGEVSVCRASHVEPDKRGTWRADLSPIGGPVLGPFPRRSDAIAAEAQWLDDHWPSTG